MRPILKESNSRNPTPTDTGITRSKFLEYAVLLVGGGVLAACAQNPTEIQNKNPTPATQNPDPRISELENLISAPIAEYIPPFQESRPPVTLPDQLFPLVPIESAGQFIERAPDDIDAVINLISANKDNTEINPGLSDLPSFQLAPGEYYFQPPTLLQVLKLMENDIVEGRVVLLEKPIEIAENAIASNTETYYLDGQTPNLGLSYIFFDN